MNINLIAAKKKLDRQLSINLFSRDNSSFIKRPNKPGQHGSKRSKVSNYGTILKEKQRLRWFYGVTERQFKNICQHAFKKPGNPTLNLLRELERRLSSAVLRAGFARTIFAARQIIRHGHIQVNGKKVDIMSFKLQPGDIVSLTPEARSMKVIAEALESHKARPVYLEMNDTMHCFKFIRLPESINEIAHDRVLNIAPIVAQYSRVV